MLLLIFLTIFQDTFADNSTDIWRGLKYGLEKNGVPGPCINYFPNLISSYELYLVSLTSADLYPKLLGFQNVTNTFTQWINTCQFEGLADEMFGIYKWDILQPILLTLASNLTLFMGYVQKLMFAIHNGLYYNIGQYFGLLISLVFGFYI